MAAPEPNTPAARIAAAVKDKPADGCCAVTGADTLAVCALVPPEKRNENVKVREAAAQAAVEGHAPGRAANIVTHVRAGDLRDLLGAAGVNPQ